MVERRVRKIVREAEDLSDSEVVLYAGLLLTHGASASIAFAMETHHEMAVGNKPRFVAEVQERAARISQTR